MRQVKLSEFKRLVQAARGTQPGVVSDVRLPPKEKWPFPRLKDAKFENVDLNSPILGGVLSRPAIVACEFVNVDLDGVNCSKAMFENSTFESCVFGRKYFGSFSKTDFINCRFEACSFVSMEFFGCAIKRCEFRECRIEAVNFRECKFDDVFIEGGLKRVNLIGCTTERVDLSRSTLVDSRVLEASSQDVLLPDRPDNFLATYDDFERAKQVLRSGLSTKGFDEYCELTEFSRQARFGELVDESFFEDLSASERPIALRVLYEHRSSRASGLTLPQDSPTPETAGTTRATPHG